MHITNHAFNLASARRPWMSISSVDTSYGSATGLTIGDDASAR